MAKEVRSPPIIKTESLCFSFSIHLLASAKFFNVLHHITEYRPRRILRDSGFPSNRYNQTVKLKYFFVFQE